MQPEMSEHCDVVMPALVAALQSERDSSIVERVAFGLDNSMEHLEEAALAKYLPAVMPPLLALLHAGDRRMHDTLLSCVSSAAAAGGDAFKPFAGASPLSPAPCHAWPACMQRQRLPWCLDASVTPAVLVSPTPLSPARLWWVPAVPLLPPLHAQELVTRAVFIRMRRADRRRTRPAAKPPLWPHQPAVLFRPEWTAAVHAAPVIEHLQRFMAITAPDALSARTAATECVGLVAETLGRAVAEQLLPPFLHAAADGFQLHATALREYGHGLFAVSARLLEDAFVPFLQGAFEMAVASIESVRPLPAPARQVPGCSARQGRMCVRGCRLTQAFSVTLRPRTLAILTTMTA